MSLTIFTHTWKRGPGGNMAKEFMTAKEVSEYLGLSRRQVYALAAERVLPHYRIETSVLFKKNGLDAFLNSKRVGVVDIAAEARRMLK